MKPAKNLATMSCESEKRYHSEAPLARRVKALSVTHHLQKLFQWSFPRHTIWNEDDLGELVGERWHCLQIVNATLFQMMNPKIPSWESADPEVTL